MLDRDAERLIAAGAGAPGYDQLGHHAARAAYNAGRKASTAPPVPLPDVRDVRLGAGPAALPARLYRPATDGLLPALVFFHGGGWVLGNLDSHDGLCRRLSQGAGAAVLSVEYRLAPEHPFPAAFDDALSAFAALRARAAEFGIDPDRIAVGGDSAGGNLAAALCLAQKAAGAAMPVVQLLIYPALDFSFDTASHRDFAEGLGLTARTLAWFRDCYLPDSGAVRDWRASPAVAGDLRALPPAIILTAEYDPLRDEGEHFAQRLAAAGVPTTLLRQPGQIHGFLPMDGVMRAAIPCTHFLARQLRLALTEP